MDPKFRFERLAENIVSAAGRVTCSPEEYIDGLEHIIEELTVAKNAAEESLDCRKGDH